MESITAIGIMSEMGVAPLGVALLMMAVALLAMAVEAFDGPAWLKVSIDQK